ncbi:HAMP domain-containing sensor histidine kinase [Sulfurimonas sp.]|uniref:sensor histidine kinase n=1 Tax=Sulfurimonas sp. TaxID=2022749 RepID=UPI0025F65598|nr:HAMP domain-containing sensor histidine kinase [Sulfurimonas sp.]MBT5933747.1 HAMP domain-containing histidine kinase [Sulfurimonas sp.]
MFTSFRVNIFIYYFITVLLFLGFTYYLLAILEIQNIYALFVIVVSFISVSALLMVRLAVNPLQEYVANLQELSKETLHELNLPINTIMTNTQMIKKSLDDEKSLKRLGRIQSACEMLQERYNELEYMIKMQSEEGVKEKFFLDKLIEERVAFLCKIYPKIDFSLSLESLEIYTDRKGLGKVIDNLIDNGVKYSQNSKKIDIQHRGSSLFIKDYGKGMDEVEILHIFESYYQSNKSMLGFGIGLSMVKRFCDKNGVELHFKSQPKLGTTVELKFNKI